jgi:anti-anti-sigma factor
MTISHHDLAPGVIAVTLSGRLTIGPMCGKIATLTDELLREGKRTIIFDLAGVTRLDSTGMGYFISSYKKIAAVGGEMRMAGANGRVRAVFRISRLDTLFPFYPTVPEAAGP